jgi:hypothetical protein
VCADARLPERQRATPTVKAESLIKEILRNYSHD